MISQSVQGGSESNDSGVAGRSMKSGFGWLFMSLVVGMLLFAGLTLGSLFLESPSDWLLLETRQAAAAGKAIAPERAAELSIQGRRQARLYGILLQAVGIFTFVGISIGAARLASAQGRRIPRTIWLGYALIAVSLALWTIGALRSDRVLDESDRQALVSAAGRPALADSSLRFERARAAARTWNWTGSITFCAGLAALMAAGVSLWRSLSDKQTAPAAAL